MTTKQEKVNEEPVAVDKTATVQDLRTVNVSELVNGKQLPLPSPRDGQAAEETYDYREGEDQADYANSRREMLREADNRVLELIVDEEGSEDYQGDGEAVQAVVALDNPFGTWTPETAKATGYKVLLYGLSGTGKTWLASTFPKPLYLDLEYGMRSVAHRKPLRYPKDPSKGIETLNEVIKFYQLCRKELEKPDPIFRTVVIDSLNAFHYLLQNDTVANFQNAERQYKDQLTLNDHGKVKRDFERWFARFYKLPCNVVFISHTEERAYEEDTYYPNLKSVTTFVTRSVDAIGFCHTLMVGTPPELKYVVSFAKTPDHLGKDRLGIGSGLKQNNYKSLFPREA